MTSATEHELNQMGLRDLQRRFHEVVGEETRCPNRIFLIRRILSATAPGASTSEAQVTTLRIDAQSNEAAVNTPPTEAAMATTPAEATVDAQPAEATTLEHLPASRDDLAAEAEPSIEPPLDDSPAEEPRVQEPSAPDAPVDVEPLAALRTDAPADEDAPVTTSRVEHSADENVAHDAADIEIEEEAPATSMEPAPNTESTPPVLALAEDESSGDKTSVVVTEDTVVTRDALAATAPPARRTRTARGAAQPSSAQTRSPRGRFREMRVAQLQALYLATVGRSTGSTDRRYLEWKIREAEKGHIPVGPRESRAAETPDADTARVLPLRLETEAVEAMDATWKSHGMKSRMEFFRRALGHYLAHLGAHGAAMHFTSHAPTG